jgi:integrase
MAESNYRAISDADCRKLKAGTIADKQCAGLRLVANKAGLRRWVYRRQVNGKLKQETIGFYPTMTLKEAREEWQDRRTQTAKEGDPLSVEVYTVRQLCRDYIDGYAKNLKRSWKEDERQLWLDIVPGWGTRPAAEITRTDVINLLEDVAKRGDRVAGLLLAVARKAWNHAIDRRDEINSNPWMRLKIVKGVCMNVDAKVSVEEKPTRCLINGKDESDLQGFLDKLPTAPMSDDTRGILHMQLLTACRKGEVCEMAWPDVNLKTAIWTIPPEKTKNKTEHRVMLPNQAVALLESRKGRKGYVFASRAAGGHIRGDSVNDTLSRCIPHFKLEHFTPHTLRHTVVTGLSNLGCPEVVIARIANHKRTSITSRYDHNPHDDEAREWLQVWADHLEGEQS